MADCPHTDHPLLLLPWETAEFVSTDPWGDMLGHPEVVNHIDMGHNLHRHHWRSSGEEQGEERPEEHP